MAVDGKKASGRLAAATCLWLLVAIFANQNCVYCEEEEELQRAQQLQQDAQLQQQKLQQQLQQQQQQQDQQPRPPQQLLPPEQLPSPPPPPPQQQQQQKPQLLGTVMGPMNRIENELPPGLKDMAETTMNAEFGGSNLQQQLRNGAGQLNIPGDGRVPMFSGSLPMVTNSQQPPTMQTDGPPRAPNFAETNLPKEVNPNTPLMLPPPGQNGRRPLLQMNKQTINPQLPLSNQQNSMNSALNPPYTQYSSQMPQRQGLPILQHFPRLPPNYLAPGKLPMDQQVHRLYPHPYYPNGNADNGYEGQTLSNSPVYPDQSTSNFNIGDMLQQPTNMLNHLMPSNTMQFAQKPMDMLFNTVDKLGRYTQGVREGVGTALKGVVGTILDETEAGAKTAFGVGLNGTTSIINLGRRFLLPGTLRTLPNSSGGGYLMQQNMQPQNYLYNPYAPSPNYGVPGYNNMQHHAGAAQYASGNNNGQLPVQHTGSQMNAEYGSQDENMQNSGMTYPVNPPQAIVQYGQPPN